MILAGQWVRAIAVAIWHAIAGTGPTSPPPAPPPPNLVVDGDFNAGGGGATFASDYSRSARSPRVFSYGMQGAYAILPAGLVAASAVYPDWTHVSTDPQGGAGNVLVADGATTLNKVVWSQVISVKPNTNYVFRFYAAEVSNPCCSNAVIAPSINGAPGPALPAAEGWRANAPFVWNSGDNTRATLALTDLITTAAYNDFALGHISFAAQPDAAQPTPEPSTWGMMIAGLGATGAVLRRRRAVMR
jgi:hypothetical protein